MLSFWRRGYTGNVEQIIERLEDVCFGLNRGPYATTTDESEPAMRRLISSQFLDAHAQLKGTPFLHVFQIES